MASLLIAVVLLGVARHAATPAFPEWLLRRAPSMDEATGTVVSFPDIAEALVSFTLAPDHLPGYLLVYWSCDQPLQQVHRGDRVCVSGSTRLPEPFDGFDYPAYLARQSIFATLFAENVVCLDDAATPFSLWNAGDRLRQRLLLRLRQALPLDLAAMAQSLLFGDRSALPQEIEDAFSRTGLMHLLAVSGLHLGIFLAAAWWVLRRMGFRPRVAYPVVGCLVLLALTIVGPRVSLVRAGLLFAFLALGSVLADCGVILKRWVHPLNGLAAAAIAILLIRPGALYDAGFQLTMAATGSILIAFSPSGWGTRLSRPSRKGILGTCGCWLRRMIVVSAAAQAGAAPVIAWHFGAFHPLSILINLVAVPLAGISLWAGLLSLLVSATAAFDLAVIPLAFLLRALEIVVKWLAQIPIAELLATPPMGLWMGGCVVFAYLMAYCESLSSRISKSMSMEFESDEG